MCDPSTQTKLSTTFISSRGMVHIASNTIFVWQKNMDLRFLYEKGYSF
jgi:hypothetical protein